MCRVIDAVVSLSIKCCTSCSDADDCESVEFDMTGLNHDTNEGKIVKIYTSIVC